MSMFETLTAGRISIGTDNERHIIVGKQVTRAGVLAETEDGINNPPIGSMYMGLAHTYIRVAKSSPGVSTDWQVITVTAAD